MGSNAAYQRQVSWLLVQFSLDITTKPTLCVIITKSVLGCSLTNLAQISKMVASTDWRTISKVSSCIFTFNWNFQLIKAWFKTFPLELLNSQAYAHLYSCNSLCHYALNNLNILKLCSGIRWKIKNPHWQIRSNFTAVDVWFKNQSIRY